METIRKISRNPFIVSFVTFSVLLLSCSQSGDDFSLVEKASTNNLSGEEMFRSIFFFDDESVASKISYFEPAIERINNLSEEQKGKRTLFIDELVSKINKLDDDYFDTFKKNMASNDPYIIKEELQKGSEIILSVSNLKVENIKNIVDESVKSEYDLSNPKDVKLLMEKMEARITSDVSSKELLREQCVAVVAVVALVAVALAAAVVIVFIVEIANQEADTGTPRLVSDEMVVKIMETY